MKHCLHTRFKSANHWSKELSQEGQSDNSEKDTNDLDHLLTFLQDQAESKERIFTLVQSFNCSVK